MRSTKRARGASAAALLVALVWTSPASGAEPFDVCPKLSTPTIEVLNFADRGSTLGFVNRVSSYSSKVCSLPRISFPGPEGVYKVILHPGNRVGFELRFAETCQLVMALVKTCGTGNSCLSNSPGNFRGGVETIKPESYPEGTYYLYIDSLSASSCPSYSLSVTGVNPVPDLQLDLKAQASVVAGEELTYTLTTANRGTLDATGVQMILTLPAGVTYRRASDKCTLQGNQVLCKVDRIGLKDSPPPSRTVTVTVDPSTRNQLAAQAVATANEGDPTSPNEASVRTLVQARSDLSIASSSSAISVAGLPTRYTLTLKNDGPSDATKVVVTDPLHSGLDSASGSGCGMQGGQLICRVNRIPAHSSTTLVITAGVKPAADGAISHDAVVAAAEHDPSPATNNRTTVRTTAVRQTNLSIDMISLSPSRQAAGREVSYQIRVKNRGPSHSKGATIKSLLPSGMTSSSWQGCDRTPAGDSCELGPLQNGAVRTVNLGALIRSDLDPQTLARTATVLARDEDTDTGNNESSVQTDVFVKADMLAQILSVDRIPWSLSSPPGPVKAGENLLYTVRIANGGPSDSRGGFLHDDLSDAGLSFVSSPDGCFSTHRTVSCPVPVLKAGEETIRRFVVGIAPSKSGPVNNEVCIDSQIAEHDPQDGNNCEEDTATQVGTEADLALTLIDSPDAVRPGADLTYTVSVRNEGPSNASAVSVDVDGTSIELGGLAAGAVEHRVVKVVAPNERGVVNVSAHVHADTFDPHEENNSAATATTVANEDDSDLALALSVDADAAVAGRPLTYQLTLSNQGFSTTEGTDVAIQFSQEVSVTPQDCCRFGPLGPGASETRQLTVEVSPEASGLLLATADIVQADTYPDNNKASVEIPVVKTSRSTELCTSWSVRFLRGQPANTSTDLLFFVPDPPGGVAAVGRVFTEAGDFVQMVSVASSTEDFRRPTLSLLARSGSIEWTFRKGLEGGRLVGNVAAIHSRAGAEVKIPGYCRQPGRIGAHALILRSFQLDAAVNTYIAIRNELADEIKVRVTYSGLAEEPRQQTFSVAGHGVSTVNLRQELGFGSGSLEIEAFSLSDGQPVDALSGDVIHVSPDGLSGSALERRPD